MTAIVSEAVEGQRLVKAYNAEEYERSRFQDRQQGYLRQYLGSLRIALLAHPLSETFGTVVIVVLLMVGSAGAWGMRPELFIAFLVVLGVNAVPLLRPRSSLDGEEAGPKRDEDRSEPS
jgi:subfamily B ATP-binding cassette protein MsbA